MQREIRALKETIQNLVNVSDGLEYVRSKIKNSKLLRSQEYLVAAIEELKSVQDILAVERRKKANEDHQLEIEQIEYLDKWKKDQEQKVLQSYQDQLVTIQKDLEGNLKKQSIAVLKKDYFNGLQTIKDYYTDAIRGDR